MIPNAIVTNADLQRGVLLVPAVERFTTAVLEGRQPDVSNRCTCPSCERLIDRALVLVEDFVDSLTSEQRIALHLHSGKLAKNPNAAADLEAGLLRLASLVGRIDAQGPAAVHLGREGYFRKALDRRLSRARARWPRDGVRHARPAPAPMEEVGGANELDEIVAGLPDEIHSMPA
jgi:hypothetical protein